MYIDIDDKYVRCWRCRKFGRKEKDRIKWKITAIEESKLMEVALPKK